LNARVATGDEAGMRNPPPGGYSYPNLPRGTIGDFPPKADRSRTESAGAAKGTFDFYS
jgi:hypothetical protein